MTLISLVRGYVICICLVVVYSNPLTSESAPKTGQPEEKKLINYGVCNTPDKEQGLCIRLDECDELTTLHAKCKLSYNETIAAFLRKSQCGYTNKTVLVCCPGSLKKKATDTDFRTRSSHVLPEPGICGNLFSDRISGGDATSLEDFPWMALLIYRDEKNIYSYKCGGSLITNRYVLTAAHCIRVHGVKLDRVRLGEWDVKTNPDCVTDVRGQKDCADPYVDVFIERPIVHEGYNEYSINQFNDIGLLRLSRIVEFTTFIQPICLPLADNLKDEFIGHKMDIVGWGKTNKTGNKSTVKLAAASPIVSFRECQDKYSRHRDHRNHRALSNNTQICAGGEIGIDSCKGDSGGPLIGFVKSNNQSYYFLAGIISYGMVDCANSTLPSVHTRVSGYIDWILQKIEP